MKRLLLAAAIALLPLEAAAQNTFFAASPGDMIYRGPSGWAPVPGGQAGQLLQSQGPTAQPVWTFDLSSVPQFKLPFMTTNTVLGNVTGGNANPTPITQTQFLDTLGYDIVRPPVIGGIPMKATFGVNGSWQVLQPGPAGWVLQSNGPGADLTWAFNSTTATPGSAGLCLVSTGPTTPPVYAICPITAANLTATAPLALSYGTPTNLALTGVVPVANGGTGVATITSNGVVVGQGTSPVVTKTGTNGQVFMSIGGVPTFTSTPSIATSLTVPSITTAAISTATMTATGSVATGPLTVTGTGAVSGTFSSGQQTVTGAQFTTGNVNSNATMTASTSMVAPIGTFATSTTSPIVYGGSAIGSTLALRPTSAAGSGGARVNVQGGTNGALQLAEFSGAAASSSLALGASGSIAGQLLLNGNTSGAVTIRPTPAAGNWQFVLPTTPGLNNQVLTSSGGGTMTWTTPAGGTALVSLNPNFINGTLVASASAGALTIAVKTNASAGASDPSGGDPVTVAFNNTTAVGSGVQTMSLTAASSVVIPSTATMGVTSTTAFRLWVVGFRDSSGPTFRLGVWNGFDGLNIFPLTEGLGTSTTIGVGSNNAGVIYSNTGVTNMPMTILGYLEWNAAGLTAGTWTTANLFKTQLLTPGAKLPGDVVRSYFFADTTASATTSPTYVATNTTAAMILTSAANIVRVRAMGSLTVIEPTQTGNAAILRGATAVSGGTLLYNQDLGSLQILSVPATLVAQDFPNTIASTNYRVGIAASVNTTSVTWNVQIPGGTGLATTANIELQEIMR